ncbi:unnamed protein product [Soboliphyme baturini]|uniref:Secreted protein n=1 Tax=Soboliphyme baturini TaxID=241478 RepID=A0A183IND4_9BILA|nr:unnamed protein product [Soboliphyme baturini]
MSCQKLGSNDGVTHTGQTDSTVLLQLFAAACQLPQGTGRNLNPNPNSETVRKLAKVHVDLQGHIPGNRLLNKRNTSCTRT